jgi:hypothetical protein
MDAFVKRIGGTLNPGKILTPVLGSVVRSVVSEAVGAPEGGDEHLDRASKVMQEKVGLMPRFLAWPMMGATLAFDLYGFAVGGRPFHSLPSDARRRQIRQWREAPISFCQDFLDFYEKMGTFVYFSERYGEGGLGAPDAEREG